MRSLLDIYFYSYFLSDYILVATSQVPAERRVACFLDIAPSANIYHISFLFLLFKRFLSDRAGAGSRWIGERNQLCELDLPQGGGDEREQATFL